MKPSEIKEILNDIGAGARKSLGQHFLIDKKVLKDIVAAAEIKKGEMVLEIGPGLGVLTRELLGAGAKVTAIEKDKKLSAFLESQKYDQLNIVRGDAAKINWDELVQEKWKCISNLPYSITSLALRKSLTAKHPPQTIVVLIQKEVAERALAKDGKQSLLSLLVGLNTKSARIVRRVGKGAFYPRPRVESAILELIPMKEQEILKRWGIETEKVMKMAKLGFKHPRKKLISNLKGEYPEIANFFAKMELSESVRAEGLTLDQWVELRRLTAL